MEITVCPGCGAVLKAKDKSCGSCGGVSSRFAATVMATPVTSSAPMVVSVAPDRLILERIVSARQLAIHAPSDYGRDDEYSVAGMFDPFGNNDTFNDFDPTFAATGGVAPMSINVAPATTGLDLDAVDGQISDNGNGNGTGNGNDNSNGHAVAAAIVATSAQSQQPSAPSASEQNHVVESPLSSYNVTAASSENQTATPFASTAIEAAPQAASQTVAGEAQQLAPQGLTQPGAEMVTQSHSTEQAQALSPQNVPQNHTLAQNSTADVNQTATAPAAPQIAVVAQLKTQSPVDSLASPSSSPQTPRDLNAPPSQGVQETAEGSPPPAAKEAFQDQTPPQNIDSPVAAIARETTHSPAEALSPARESPPQPQRPKVAAPDFFASAPNTKPKQTPSEDGQTESAPRPKPAQSSPAFDFFAASASSTSKSASNGRQEHGVEADRDQSKETKGDAKSGRSEKNDALSSFENLLAKQSKTGQHDPLGNEKIKVKPRNRSFDDDEDLDDHFTKSKEKTSTASSNRLAFEQKEERAKAARARRGEEEDDGYDGYGEDEEPKRAKVKRPPMIKRQSKKDEDGDEDEFDDEHDDEHDDDEEEERPKRRSFSGGSAATSGGRLAKKSSRSDGKVARSLKDDDDDDDLAPIDRLKEKLRTGGLSFGGLPISMGHLALGIGIIGLLFFAVSHVMGNLAHIGGGAGGQEQGSAPPALSGNAPSVSGIWFMEVEDRGRIFPGKITLEQNGATIGGTGTDKIGAFTINGYMMDGNGIVLKKRFVDQNNRESGPIITFTGKVDLVGIPMRAGGTWEFTKKSGSQFGYYNKVRSQTFQGQWRSTLRKSIPSNQIASSFTPGETPPTPGQSTASKFNIIKFAISNGIWIALGVGVLAIGSSFILFGPDGLINIWNKKKYIPSQFKTQHTKIRGQLARTLRKGSLPLGQRVEWRWYFPMPWIAKDLALPPDMRRINPHVLILGQGGKGKTRLVSGMIAHDIESNDRAVVCIDSDGTLVDLITRWVAAHPRGAELAKRVILIDPTYRGETIAFNPLEMPERGDIQSAATSIVYGFKAIYSEPPGAQSQWNAQTADILRNSVLLLMANDKTLLDLPTLLQDNDFRDIMLESVERRKNERVEFETLCDQWGRYKKMARTDQWISWIEPILNRLNPMLSNPRIRAILTKPDGDLKINDVIVGKKVLLVKIPQGEFGQDANLLGSLIVAGVKQAALTLSSVAPKTQQEVALYLDNFDNFIEKETVDNITSETKKFKIGLIGVTKTLQHLPEDFRNQLIINIGTLLTFALSKKDGDLLGPQMFPIDGRKVKHQTMSNLFNRVNTSPQFELVSDEEKLNIDKIVRQEERTFFCYRMGAEAGLFNLKSHPFEDIPNSRVKKKLLQKMHLSAIKKSKDVES